MNTNPAEVAPTINRLVACIVDRESASLAAILSSHLTNDGSYLPLFTFPRIREPRRDEAQITDDDFVPSIVGSEAAVKIANAIARLRPCEYVIYAGLSESQKTYLKAYIKVRVVEIPSIKDIADKLAEIGLTKPGELRCNSEQVLLGLYHALQSNRHLVIDEAAAPLLEVPLAANSLVLIEQNLESADTVAAVNYAHAIGADIKLVAALGHEEPRQVLNLMHAWRNGDQEAIAHVASKVQQRAGDIDFTRYKFATFFTEGLPYSLFLKNQIPFSSVALDLQPGLFIVNCIQEEEREPFGSAIVFCHEEFGDDSEAGCLIELLSDKESVVRVLAGRDAMVYNLDYNVQHFPYDILHIVSHGGLMSGNAIRQTFTDRDGRQHEIEFDEVVGFEVRPGRKKIGVWFLRIFRTLDGFVWRSLELKKQNLPRHVYTEMQNAISNLDIRKRTAIQTRKDDIPASRAILCNDSFHQGLFRSLAAYTSPVIFNNACWSWSDIASFFLSAGARGYVGTYWDILDRVAVLGAEAFYEAATDGAAHIDAVHHANQRIATTDDANIYMYWGLHFSRLKFGANRATNQKRVLNALIKELFLIIDSVPGLEAPDVRANSFEAIRLIRRDLKARFELENAEELELEIQHRLYDATRALIGRMRLARKGRKREC